MFDRFSKLGGRKAVLATAAVVALTMIPPTASFAGGRHWHGGGGAAAAAVFGLAATGLAAIVQPSVRSCLTMAASRSQPMTA